MSRHTNLRYHTSQYIADKTQNLIINMDHENWTLKDEQTLQEVGCGNICCVGLLNCRKRNDLIIL